MIENRHSKAKNNNMARRNERGSPTKWGVLVCGVGQAFWLLRKKRAKKLAVCAIVVVVFCTLKYKKFNQITSES